MVECICKYAKTPKFKGKTPNYLFGALAVFSDLALLKEEVKKEMAQDVEGKVKEIVVEQLSVDPEQVTLQASFVNDLGADSLDTVELVMALEEEFDLEIPDEEAEKIATVGQAVEYIKTKLQEKKSS